MSALGPLFDLSAPLGRLEREFEAFHAANPHVYATLVTLARRWVAAGNRHLGIATLFEVARYDRGLQTNRAEGDFKLNNNHRAFYARLIMQRERDLAGLFETRGLRS